nr:Phosphate import ATP-binding protein like [Ipomoea batatas]
MVTILVCLLFTSLLYCHHCMLNLLKIQMRKTVYSLTGRPISSKFEANRKRARNIYTEVLRSYDDEVQDRAVALEFAKRKILGYTPGSWTELVGGTNLRDYKVPKTTIILLIGIKGSGKSSLVNKISDVFESERFTPQRAQVSPNPSVGGCTCFAHGYKILSSEKSFCVYDAQSLSYNQSENENMLKHWMTNGVDHEEPFIWCHAQKAYYLPILARPINFVVFVVNAVSVLESMEGRDETEKRYTRVVSKVFNSPLLLFKDDRPVVVVTHGDLLSVSERVRVRVHLGDLLGIHPKKQIFDIPESNDCATKLAILDMLHYCLDHADQNLPLKEESTILGGEEEEDFSVRSPASSILSGDGGVDCESGVDEVEGFEKVGRPISYHKSEASLKRARNVYREVLRSYDDELKDQAVALEYAKRKILGYTPGSWTEAVGGTHLRDYKVPKTTTILLIGTKGSGKSSLVNKISDVFDSERDSDYVAGSTTRVKYSPAVARPINFVVFVVNAVSVLESMEGRDETEKRYTRVVSKAFNRPFLSFKNDKPVVVVTHGDLLSVSDRVRVRVHLGDLLGIHPKNQIFDIPESNDCATKLAILDMLHYCLDHADKNLPFKGCSSLVVFAVYTAAADDDSYAGDVSLSFRGCILVE